MKRDKFIIVSYASLGVLAILLVIFSLIASLLSVSQRVSSFISAKKNQDPAILDQEAYGRAADKLDIDLCNAVKDEGMKNLCRESVSDLILYNEAVKQFDARLCDKIVASGRQADCRAVVDSGVAYLNDKDPLYLAEVYTRAHNEDSLVALEEALKTEPDNFSLMLELATALAEKGLIEQGRGNKQDPYVNQALALVEQARKIKPDDAELFYTEAYIYEIKPDLFKAITLYDQAIAKDQNHALAYAGRGHVHSMIGALEKAMEDFHKAAELDRDKNISAIYSNICRIASSRVDMKEEAVRNCQTVIDMDKKADVSSIGQAHQILSFIRAGEKNYAEAEKELLLAKAIAPFDSNLYLSLAVLAMTQSQPDQAKKHLGEALKISPKKSTAYYYLARLDFEEANFEQSIKDANIGLAMVDDDVSLLNPNKDELKQDFYYILADAYKAKSDTANEQKYKVLGDEIIKEISTE
jgi:tetratricopeptide (TPR) repeat protein